MGREWTVLGDLEKRPDMAFGDDQRMARTYRKTITNDKTRAIRGNDAGVAQCVGNFAERANGLHYKPNLFLTYKW